MFRTVLLFALLAGALSAQTPVSDAPFPDPVVALNGRTFTGDEIKRIVAGLPSQAQVMFQRDPKAFLQQHAMYLAMEKYADENGLDKQSPYREALAFQRMVLMNQAAANHKLQSINVLPEEQKEYYAKHQDEFREAKVRMIVLPFTTGADDKLVEDGAKTKAAAAVKRARMGEPFEKIQKEFGMEAAASEPFAVRKNSPQPPMFMRQIILGSKPDSVTEPLRHDNGYYVFLVDAVTVSPFEQVRDDIYKTIRDSRYNQWMEQMRSQVSVEFKNEAFFTSIGQQK